MRYKFSILLALIVSTQIFAQYSNSSYTKSEYNTFDLDDLSFGLRLSPSISWVDIQHNDATADGAALKFNVGIIADYEINSILSIISGVNYNNAGGYAFDNQSLDNTSTKDNYKINYTSVEVPLGLRLQTNNISNTDYYIQGGVSASFILKANEKYKSSIADTEIPSLDIISLTAPTYVGFFGTIGVEFTVAKTVGLFIDVTYKNSTSSIAIGNNYVNPTDLVYDHGYTEPIDIRSGSMDFSVGIMF